MDKNKILSVVVNQTMTSGEVLKELGISRARLSQLVKTNKLTRIKNNLFLKDEIIERKREQEGLRAKFYRPPKDPEEN